MEDNKTFSAVARTEFRKSAAKRIRNAGKIPAVIYGHSEPVHVSLDEREFMRKFGKNSESTIITVNVEGKEYDVLIKDFQEDIVKGQIKHVDFFEIERGKTLKTHVPIHLVGTAKGVKEGGVLEQQMHEFEVECLPKDIPEAIEIDVKNLLSGDAIHVGDVVVPEGVKILSAEDLSVVSVTVVKQSVEAAEEDEAEGEEAEESAE